MRSFRKSLIFIAIKLVAVSLFLIAMMPANVSAQTPTPVSFSVIALTVSPRMVNQGETVTALVKVTNIGSTPGQHEVVLNFNNTRKDSKIIRLGPGGTTDVRFTFSADSSGIVEVGGLTASIAVEVEEMTLTPTAAPPAVTTTPPVTAPASTNWLMYGLIAAGVLVVVIVLVIVFTRRKSN